MSKSLVSLDPDFITNMSKAEWPKGEAFYKWLKNNYVGMRRAHYGHMQDGLRVPFPFVVGFTAYLYDRLENRSPLLAVKVFTERLRKQGIEEPLNHSPDTLAEYLLPKLQRDYLTDDVGGILELMSLDLDKRCMRACNDEKDVREATRWMFITLGREREETVPPRSERDAIQAAEDYLHTTLSAYQEHAVGWQKVDAWTYVYVQRDGRDVGMACILPLKQESYSDFREGKRLSWQVAPSDLRRPSRLLQIESFGSRPIELGGDPQITDFGLMTILCQIAALSYMKGSRNLSPRYALSSGATPRNRHRLQSSGYKIVQEGVLGTELQVLEKVVPMWGSGGPLNVMLNLLGSRVAKKLSPPRRRSSGQRGSEAD